MQFYVQKNSHQLLPTFLGQVDPPAVVLTYDSWNDFGYQTFCNAHYVQARDNTPPQSLGGVRIMYRGQPTQWKSATEDGEVHWVFGDGPSQFTSLRNQNREYCSLSTSIKYYQALLDLGRNVAVEILRALCDAAFDSSIWSSFEGDKCFETSLLRNQTNAVETRDLVHRLYGIATPLTSAFAYKVKLPGAANEHDIDFDFTQVGGLPNRLNLIVGVNGSGKTQLLAKLAIALTRVTAESVADLESPDLNDRPSPRRKIGDAERRKIEEAERRKIAEAGRVDPIPSFYAAMAISFNPFDQFERPNETVASGLRYTYCGIRSPEDEIFSQDDLIERLRQMLQGMNAKRRTLMRRALKNVIGITDDDAFLDPESPLYRQLSAGQKIALNVLAHLITNLRRRTLVLLDEPETHLHPSLMAALMSELGRILESEDCFAIVASHSPIIAQQVPSRYIRVIRRHEDTTVEVTRPDIECFGESLSEITNALFEAKEYERDYTHVLIRLLKKHNYDPKEVEAEFPDGLGSNARVFLFSKARQKKEGA